MHMLVHFWQLTGHLAVAWEGSIMKIRIYTVTVLLLVVALLTSIPGLPLGADLRGRWLQAHMIVAAPLSGLLVGWIWCSQDKIVSLKASAWLCISIGLASIIVPMLGFITTSESTHRWVESHGWLSFLGVGLLGISAARTASKK
jgi:hypothetical protein